MTLPALRTEIVAELTAQLVPTLTAFLGKAVTVSTHEGPFDEKTLERCGKSSPAVVVAFDKITTEIQGTSVMAEVNVVVTCITKDATGVKRDVAGLILSQEVLRALGRFVPSTSCARVGKDFVSMNMYSEKIARTGCHLWVIGYRQSIELEPISAATLDDFLLMHAEYNLHPTDDDNEAEDDITLAGGS